MAVLSDRDILYEMQGGRLGISDYSEKSLTPNGYDLRVAEISINGTVYKEGVVKIPARTMYYVSTIERVALPDDVCANLWLRTSWIRKGSVGAFGMIDAGFEGTLTLGAYNASESEIEITIGERY
ncbi:MAG: dCTP deaminase [archaeon]|nr:dCTP deaminase [archaeon]